MSKIETLHDRMKHNYEEVNKTRLTRRTPVIIRLDGKAFHTLTKGLKKPYDEIFHTAMNETMLYLCRNIQGCKIGYTQSDEITLLLTDFDTLTTDAWFDYEVQKMCSVSASMATLAFNMTFNKLVKDYTDSSLCWCQMSAEDKEYLMSLHSKTNKAMFDSRCFNIPEEEVTNCFIWRQQDATRNSLQMIAQSFYTAKELNKKGNSILLNMIEAKGVVFDNLPLAQQRGVCAVRDSEGWYIDCEIPLFSEKRDYIEKTMIKEG